MRRRGFIAGLGAATALPLAIRAQQAAKKPRMGMLWHAGNAEEEAIFLAAFRQGLADAGYIEGHNIVVEHRFPNEIPEHFHAMAEELARLNPDVLAAAGQPPSLALQQATSTIPIVFISVYDPVGVGLVSNLARPTGNITGLSNPDLIGKRLEIFKEVFPDLSRVAVLLNATNPSYLRRYVEAVEIDARNLGLTMQPLEVKEPADLERAFSAITSDAGTGVAAMADVMFYVERKRIAELALGGRLPTLFHNEEFVRSGGFMSYGANIAALFRRAGAYYIDKILKGAKPGDLPVELPTLYRFFVNLGTAKELGLSVPPTILTRADEVIE